MRRGILLCDKSSTEIIFMTEMQFTERKMLFA